MRRFLVGMKNGEARFEIEYNKEPEDIDQAMYHAVSDAKDSGIERQEDTDDYECALRQLATQSYLPTQRGNHRKQK